MAPRVDAAITLRDGRRLAYAEFGTPAGRPVLFCHGMPGSRLWCPDEAATIAADVRLIIPDRPGIGRSDPKPRRSIGDWTADALELADALGLSMFGVVGVSGGGQYAAACAARIPSRLTGAAIVSSNVLAIYDWEGRPGIVESWGVQDREEFELARGDPDAAATLAADRYREWATQLRENPASLHGTLDPSGPDGWFFEVASRVAALDAALSETARQEVDALAWELNAVYLPWGFRLRDISIPVTIWHGAQDPLVSREDIDYQVAAIPRATLRIWPDSGHLGAARHFDEVLANLAS